MNINNMTEDRHEFKSSEQRMSHPQLCMREQVPCLYCHLPIFDQSFFFTVLIQRESTVHS